MLRRLLQLRGDSGAKGIILAGDTMLPPSISPLQQSTLTPLQMAKPRGLSENARLRNRFQARCEKVVRDLGGAELKGGVDHTRVQRIKFQVPVSFPAQS